MAVAVGVLSVVLMPAIVIDCWKGGDLGRAAALLLLSAWLTRNEPFAVMPALLACVAAAIPSGIGDRRHTRLILMGSCAFLAASLVILAGEVRNSLPELDTIRAGRRHYLVRIGEAQALAYGGLLPAAALALATWAVHHATRRSAVLLTALGLILLLSLLPYSLQTWRHTKYAEERYQAFAPWRAAIPESAEVLWPDPPQVPWFELGRASFWSLYQMAGMVFSRDATMVGTSRETALESVLPALGRTTTTDKHYALTPSPTDTHANSVNPCSVPEFPLRKLDG